MPERIYIFDTTLRDGEQSPGATMNPNEKLQIARQLEKLGVDIMEAGFPASSEGDREAVRRISDEIHGPRIVALARTTPQDIETAWKAVESATNPGLHTFIATSDIHMNHKLRMSREEVIESAGAAVRLARSHSDWVEFSCEDATRSDPDFMCQVIQVAVDEGACTINIPDTVGYSFPDEMALIVRYVREHVRGIDKVVVSVHCHNDLGLAVGNSLAGLLAGARQVECTVNGIGERAGNAALEEIAMILKTREASLNFHTGIVTEQIFPASRQVSTITGLLVQANKAIVGSNAFSHEAGIHQHGIMQDRTTYEIMDPESIGVGKSSLILGKHSGRHAFAERVRALGYHLVNEEIDRAFRRFKSIADHKKTVFDEDIEAIIAEEVLRTTETYKLMSLTVMSGSDVVPTATVRMEIEGTEYHGAELGNGPVDATYNAILKLTGRRPQLVRFSISAITGGTDALGEATIRLMEDGNVALGQGTHEDILVASAKAMVNALNRLDYLAKKPKTPVQP